MMIAPIVPLGSSSLQLARVAINAMLTNIQIARMYVKVSLSLKLACDVSCDGCTDTGNTNCKACDSSYIEIGDTLAGVRCESDCVDGYYQHSSTLCKACDDTCLTCTGPSTTECASCGGATHPNLKDDKSCSLTCDSNQIAVANVC